MPDKERKYKTYTLEMKLEAIRLHVEDKWTFRQITEKFEIHDKDRLKKWMRKYRREGELGLVDNRGRTETYVDENREFQKVKRQNEMLKKCLEIWQREVRKASMRSSKKSP